MKIIYKPKSQRDKIIAWLDWFEFKKIKINVKGFDIYQSTFSYHNVIILRKRSVGFRCYELKKHHVRDHIQHIGKRRYVIPIYQSFWTGKLITKNIDINHIKSKEQLCKYIVNSNIYKIP